MWLRQQARPLAPDEPCPTLFRYPGPCGLIDALNGLLGRLGRTPGGELWMAEQSFHEDVAGAALFGTLAVLQPLRHAPCETERPGIYIGVNGRCDGATFVWLPPSELHAPLEWDALSTAEQAEEALGPHDDEREHVRDRLAAYLEELDALAATGAPRPERPWCELPLGERQRRLEERGVTGRFSV